MAHYDAPELPYYICNFKKNETRKYRDAVCNLWGLKYEAVAMDGNCFFAAVSTCFKQFDDARLSLSAADLRSRVVAWLAECNVP